MSKAKNPTTDVLPPNIQLTFDPSDPDQVREVQLLLSAGRLHSALYDIYYKVRNITKYGEYDELPVEVENLLEEIKQIAGAEVFRDDE